MSETSSSTEASEASPAATEAETRSDPSAKSAKSAKGTTDATAPDYLGIPAIPERFLPIYSAAWWALAIGALVSVLAGLTFDIQEFQEPVISPYGIEIDDGGGVVVVIEAYGSAVDAGMRGEDEAVLEVDGQPLDQFDDPFLAFFDLLEAKDNSPVELLVEHSEGEPQVTTLVPSTDNVEARYAGSGLNSVSNFAIFMVVNAIYYLGLLIYAFLLFGRRREVVPQILAFALMLMFLGSSLIYGRVPLWIETVHNYAYVIGYALMLVGIVLFPNGKFIPRWSIFLVLTILGVLGYEMFFPPPEWLLVMVDIGFPLAILAALFQRYRAIEDIEERQQMRLAFLGIAIGAFIFGVLTLVEQYEAEWLPGRFWDVWIPHVLNLVPTVALHIMLGALIFSLLRLRLYDADAAISRSAAVALVTLILVAVFAGIEEVASKLGEQYFSSNASFVASGLGAGVAAMLIIPLHEKVQAWAERRFQGLLVSLRSDLQDKVTDLRETAELEPILAEVNDRLSFVLHAQRVATLVDIDGKMTVFEPRNIAPLEVEAWFDNTVLGFGEGLQREKTDLLFPARLPLIVEEIGADRLIGWILLGPRPDGSFFRREECDALNDVASPIARSIDVVQRRSKLDQDRLSRIEALETKLKSLENRIGESGIVPG